jgi:hypothetical protein
MAIVDLASTAAALAHRADCARAATLGRYSRTMENELAA